MHAALASEMGSEDAIDKVICESLTHEQLTEYEQWEHIRYQVIYTRAQYQYNHWGPMKWC